MKKAPVTVSDGDELGDRVAEGVFTLGGGEGESVRVGVLDGELVVVLDLDGDVVGVAEGVFRLGVGEGVGYTVGVAVVVTVSVNVMDRVLDSVGELVSVVDVLGDTELLAVSDGVPMVMQ